MIPRSYRLQRKKPKKPWGSCGNRFYMHSTIGETMTFHTLINERPCWQSKKIESHHHHHFFLMLGLRLFVLLAWIECRQVPQAAIFLGQEGETRKWMDEIENGHPYGWSFMAKLKAHRNFSHPGLQTLISPPLCGDNCSTYGKGHRLFPCFGTCVVHVSSGLPLLLPFLLNSFDNILKSWTNDPQNFPEDQNHVSDKLSYHPSETSIAELAWAPIIPFQQS